MTENERIDELAAQVAQLNAAMDQATTHLLGLAQKVEDQDNEIASLRNRLNQLNAAPLNAVSDPFATPVIRWSDLGPCREEPGYKIRRAQHIGGD